MSEENMWLALAAIGSVAFLVMFFMMVADVVTL